jgi:S-adenosylmethionine:tRNA ribosyltransferase-isomerase
MISPILLSEYAYDLPDERIAKYPLEKRDESKLLIFENGQISDHIFKQLPDLLPEKTWLVFNDTKVIPARLFFQKETGAHIEVFLLSPLFPTSEINLAMETRRQCSWDCLVGNRKRWKNEALRKKLHLAGQEIVLEAELEIQNEKNIVHFSWNGDVPFVDIVEYFGQLPLPPYLHRAAEASDYTRYQTVYSQQKGAVAAPTAGLHFTPEVLEILQNRGFGQDFLTLHVGAGTFQPVKVDNAVEHTMHSEQWVVSRRNIENLLANLGHIVPVGTTSMRTLESLFWVGVKIWQGHESVLFTEKLFPYQTDPSNLPTPKESLSAILNWMEEQQLSQLTGETEIMIFKGYNFQLCEGVITNFHQPSSTLLLLISALIGDNWKAVYQHALANGYRFLSFGDSSFLKKTTVI